MVLSVRPRPENHASLSENVPRNDEPVTSILRIFYAKRFASRQPTTIPRLCPVKGIRRREGRSGNRVEIPNSPLREKYDSFYANNNDAPTKSIVASAADTRARAYDNAVNDRSSPGVFGVFRTFPYRNSRTRSKRRANCPCRISAEQIYVRFSKIDRPKQERYGRRCSRLLSSSRDFSCNAAVFYFFVDALRRKPMTIVF